MEETKVRIEVYGYNLYKRLVILLYRLFSDRWVLVTKQIDLKLYDRDEEE